MAKAHRPGVALRLSTSGLPRRPRWPIEAIGMRGEPRPLSPVPVAATAPNFIVLSHRRPVCDCPSVQLELNAELNAMSDDEFAAVIGAADQQMAQQLARAQACL